jgi:anti-sigma-K factor RskA
VTNSDHIREEELELYALGGLPEPEAAALKSHLATCGECAMKLAQSRGSAALLSFATRQEDPAGTIKAELLARLRANREHEEHYAWPLPAKQPAKTTTGNDQAPNSRETTARWSWVLVPTAVALALVSLGLSWQNRRQSQALEKQRQATQALLHQREDTEKLVAVLAAGDTMTVKLAPVGGALGSGVVRYNGRMGVLVYSAQLPAVPPGKSYQMWLMPATGSPISAGVLEKGSHDVGSVWLADVPANTEAKAFAVTVEPAGGGPRPTGAQVLVGGL